MTLDTLFYTYKQIGIVEKNGVKYKKFAKVPRLRTKHKRVVFYAMLVVLTFAAAFAVVRRFAERSPASSEAVG